MHESEYKRDSEHQQCGPERQRNAEHKHESEHKHEPRLEFYDSVSGSAGTFEALEYSDGNDLMTKYMDKQTLDSDMANCGLVKVEATAEEQERSIG